MTTRRWAPAEAGPSNTTADLRRQNLSRCLRLVAAGGPISRAALTSQMGVARGTVGVLIETLQGAGLIRETTPAPVSGRGRPSPILELVPDAATVLAVDLAVDAVRLSVVGLGGVVVSRTEWPYDVSVDRTIERLVAELRAASRQRRAAGSTYQAVGVAVWGIVRGSDGLVNVAPNLGWRDVPLGRRLVDELVGTAQEGLVQDVIVANDADLGAIAESRRGAGRDSSRMLYVHSDVGVGGGLVQDGELMTAVSSYAGEVGHMIVNLSGERCRCGSIGCWETLVDERALLKAAGEGDLAADVRLEDRVSEILRRARAGDEVAWAAVEEVSTAVGLGLSNLVHLLGPDLIVLGGYLADLYSTCPGPTQRVLRDRGFSPEARDVGVVPAKLGHDAAALGAAEVALDALFADPVRPR